jgi:trehalose/maltose hydrolase-like predicted phosphorylase
MGKREARDWELIYTDWDPEEQGLRESLCALGNGLFVTRGAFEETHASGIHYPGTYMAGGFNRLETEIAGQVVENEDLVNWPNWLPLSFRAEGGDWFDLESVEISDFSYRLDLLRGVLERRVRFRDPLVRDFTLTSRRIVSMAQPHLAAIEWSLTAHNWSGLIEFRSGIDGTVVNDNVERYSDLNSQHLEVIDSGYDGDDTIFLTARTNQSLIQMTQAARTRIYSGDNPLPTQRERVEEDGRIAQGIFVHCQQQKPISVEKIVAIFSSRDFAIADSTFAARKWIHRAGNFTELLKDHETTWRRLWNISDIDLNIPDIETQLILRLHIFHILQTTSPNTIDRDIGVPSRGWHGEAYRGHILWDELFVFPTLTLRIPELARSLLMYRYRRLNEARHLATQAGYEGAKFPWQSGSDGREESQVLHLNPLSGTWDPDVSNIQRHVNAAIAFNIWLYYESTGDMEFLSYYGAEMFIEIARFWSSIATYSHDLGRYEIRGVMGPDEFHTGYPQIEEPGLNNNAYTNVMAAWVLRRAHDMMELLEEERRNNLIEELDISDEEFIRWDLVSRKMFVPFHDDQIISQFQGYEQLEEFDWDGYRNKYGNIHRLDRILKAENDHPNHYKASKQADVVMLFYLFSEGELKKLFGHMGYEFDPELIPRNIEYYMKRTSHGSTLSRVVHFWVLSRVDRIRDWSLFYEALRSDIDDIQQGTTPEGIHLGAMAGTVDIVQRCHTGLEMHDGVLWFDPALPRELSDVRMRIRYRGHWLSVRLTTDKLHVSFDRGWSDGVLIGFCGNVYAMAQGDMREFEVLPRTARQADDE